MANERQIPKTKEFLCNPLYWDIVYGYIQVNSEWDGIKGHPRILPKKKAVFTKIGEYLGLSRQTVAKHFKDLGAEGLNLIKKLDNGDYEITILDNEVATLIDSHTLRMLTCACNDHTISIYVYLYSRWKASQEGGFIFTIEQLKKVIGIGCDSTSNNYIINAIINVLCLIGVLEIKVITALSDNGGYKTMFQVIGMKDKVDDKIAEAALEERRLEKISGKKC